MLTMQIHLNQKAYTFYVNAISYLQKGNYYLLCILGLVRKLVLKISVKRVIPNAIIISGVLSKAILCFASWLFKILEYIVALTTH